jgi:hypothetical protein
MRLVLPNVPIMKVLVGGWYCLESYESAKFFSIYQRSNLYTCPTLMKTPNSFGCIQTVEIYHPMAKLWSFESKMKDWQYVFSSLNF